MGNIKNAESKSMPGYNGTIVKRKYLRVSNEKNNPTCSN